MEGFRIDLKTFLGLAMPNQYCQKVNIGVIIVGPKSPNLHDPYNSITVIHDKSKETKVVPYICRYSSWHLFRT